MARKLAATVFCLGCLHSGSSFALGLGELKLDSFLNEPLRARVDLLDTTGLQAEQIRVRLATKEDFQRLGVERAYFLTDVSFEVIIDGANRGQIVVTSEDPVLEPYLDFIVEARWPAGRLLREYTVLVDPPIYQQSSTVVSASAAVAVAEGGSDPVKDQKKNSSGEVAVQSGSRARDSGTADGSRGQYGGDARAVPSPGEQYLIRRDDTLWEVASAGRPAGASVHQTMLDIQRLNPDAFIDGNINRIKAGYVIYMPGSEDISSADRQQALQQVAQQNEDWRGGLKSQPSDPGPSLKISAPTEQPGAETAQAVAASVDSEAAVVQERLEQAARERREVESRLAAMEQQLQTLQQIVTLKDEQIAALQGALSDVANITDPAVQAGQEALPADQAASAAASVDDAVVAPAAAPASTPTPEQVGVPRWISYAGAGLAVLLGLGLWLSRRGRSAEDGDAQRSPEDVFADVELQQESLELDDDAFVAPLPEVIAAAPSALEPATPDDRLQEASLTLAAKPVRKDLRGYGESTHDEYAADVDTGDALAEADIYVAYGRTPQAIELLNNALHNEPGNPRYLLKLLGLYADSGDMEAAQEQYVQLQSTGDQESLLEADHILKGGPSVPQTPGGAAGELPLELELGDFDIPETQELDDGFAGLEIEDISGAFSDELDLTKDFGSSTKGLSADDEDEMIFATEGNEMSTKLDLARAYMDMGDDEGARQILDEVASEGTADQRQEAVRLTQRLG